MILLNRPSRGGADGSKQTNQQANKTMKVLLRKDVDTLGIVGDVIEVTPGFARNYLFPHRLAIRPTKGNVRALAQERAAAEERRRLALEQKRKAAAALKDVEVMISAPANEDGVLYGSVGARDIAYALAEKGHPVKSDYVKLTAPIRHVDKTTVEIRFASDITAEVKVWVVREGHEQDALDKDKAPKATADDSGKDGADVDEK